MTVDSYLYFLSDIGKEKINYQSNKFVCPFCNREELSEILAEEDSILLVKNKFPTLADTFQTVIIETDDCSANMSTYDKAYMRKIITFGTNHWLRMEESGDFKSVVFYKNHGPLSGGTINHPHMQIVGLKNIDYKQNLKDEFFEGVEIYRAGDCILNISTRPMASITEFNIITPSRHDHFMADNVQIIVNYILTRLPHCSSFNLFFYQWNHSIICKIIPRYVTSPYLVGFRIPQTSNRTDSIAEEIRKAHFRI